MPTVFKAGPYRFFFCSSDRDEPPHIHVEHDDRIAKFWLDPARLQNSGGFNRFELNRIQRMIETRHSGLLEAWNAYFGG